ncbi:hypothetical protein BpHYR1_032154 [Brachionus plicatilis]|uniref:Uncharacterized protein n=1 Tax=Brachionus plicatilis TaxID=10195 RepID=A0A3M7QA90_BRAPC|nr:hypothetical protein BpHYR1_032154 [Brachionus plicatilis]
MVLLIFCKTTSLELSQKGYDLVRQKKEFDVKLVKTIFLLLLKKYVINSKRKRLNLGFTLRFVNKWIRYRTHFFVNDVDNDMGSIFEKLTPISLYQKKL